MPTDFSKEVKERPKCEDCGNSAIRAIPTTSGKFICLCEKCYQERKIRPLKEQLKTEILEELKNDYEFVPKVKK